MASSQINIVSNAAMHSRCRIWVICYRCSRSWTRHPRDHHWMYQCGQGRHHLLSL